MRYVEERQRQRWPGVAITRRAQGCCGLIQRQNSSPMLRHRNRHPSLSEPRKTPARDPLYFLNSFLEPCYPSVGSRAPSRANSSSISLRIRKTSSARPSNLRGERVSASTTARIRPRARSTSSLTTT